MSRVDWKRAREILERVLSYPEEEQDAQLAAECAEDGALLERLQQLLQQERRETRFLERAGPVAQPSFLTLSAGQTIGSYELVRTVGRGGMGEVWEAEQSNPRRKVALKLLRPGLHENAETRSRFEFEAAVLARLKHPGIAQVYEAGVDTVAGGELHWFAMEFVEGASTLTGFARGRELAIDERLALFCEVCLAVHHGHQRGIIHRDIKPANVLVDSAGRPRVIDFGIARAHDAEELAHPMLTRTGHFIGTLQYMAPEQLDGHSLDLDLRCDVHGLGLLLYELLTDEQPFRLDGLPIDDAVRELRTRSAPRPSERNPDLARDLDAITLMALSKDPARRYESAAALAADVRRHLDHLPVEARPPSVTYYARLFARRHRAVVVASIAIVAALVAATVISVDYALAANAAGREERAMRKVADDEAFAARLARAEEERMRSRAELAEQDALRQLEVARTEARKSSAIRRFLEEMIVATRPGRTGREARVADVLDASRGEIETRFAAFPEVRAALHGVVGSTYNALGLYAEAERELELAWRTRVAVAGEDDLEALSHLQERGFALGGLARLEESEEALRTCVEARARLQGAEHVDVAIARSQLAMQLLDRGRAEEALREYESALSILGAQLAPDDERRLDVQDEYAQALSLQGRFAEAEVLLKASLEVYERDGTGGLQVDRARFLLACCAGSLGRLEESIAALEQVVAERIDVFGERHANTLIAMYELANTLRELGRLDEAEPWFRRALDAQVEVYGEEHPNTSGMINGLAALVQYRGDYAAAEELYRRALVIGRAQGGVNNEAALAANNLAGVLMDQGRFAEAAPVAREAGAQLGQLYPADHPFPLASQSQLAYVLWKGGEQQEGEALLFEVLERQTALFGEDDPNRLMSLCYLASFAHERGALEDAAGLYREAFERHRRQLGLAHAETLFSLVGLIDVQVERGELADAEALAQALLEGRQSISGPGHPSTQAAAERLASIRAAME